MWLKGKNLWNENMSPQQRLNSNLTLHFFSKMRNMPHLDWTQNAKLCYEIICMRFGSNIIIQDIKISNIQYWTEYWASERNICHKTYLSPLCGVVLSVWLLTNYRNDYMCFNQSKYGKFKNVIKTPSSFVFVHKSFPRHR